MTYKELADCLRVAKQGERNLPSGDFDVVRMFTPATLNRRLLDLIVADSASLDDFNVILKIYQAWRSP